MATSSVTVRTWDALVAVTSSEVEIAQATTSTALDFSGLRRRKEEILAALSEFASSTRLLDEVRRRVSGALVGFPYPLRLSRAAFDSGRALAERAGRGNWRAATEPALRELVRDLSRPAPPHALRSELAALVATLIRNGATASASGAMPADVLFGLYSALHDELDRLGALNDERTLVARTELHAVVRELAGCRERLEMLSACVESW